MANHKFTVRYDGRDFFGWQRHKDKPTVQGAIEGALASVTGAPATINGSGRTDRGAHAMGQVFSALLPADHAQALPQLVTMLNAALPEAIEVLDVCAASDEFHARASAKGKIYRYEIYNAPKCPPQSEGKVWHIPGPLDVAPMRQACELFVGELDFASFATKPNFKQKSTRRHLRRAELTHAPPRVSIVLEADGFLYKMVRNIVRAVVKVGEGRTSLDDLRRIIDARDRKAAPGSAPASGLFLDSVQYD